MIQMSHIYAFSQYESIYFLEYFKIEIYAFIAAAQLFRIHLLHF